MFKDRRQYPSRLTSQSKSPLLSGLPVIYCWMVLLRYCYPIIAFTVVCMCAHVKYLAN